MVVLPLLVCLAASMSFLSAALLERDRTERAAWTYAMARAHKTERREAESLSAQAFGDDTARRNYRVDEGLSCAGDAASALRAGGRVPPVFAFFLGVRCRSTHRIANEREVRLLRP